MSPGRCSWARAGGPPGLHPMLTQGRKQRPGEVSWRQVWEARFLMPSCGCPQPHPCFGPWADNCFPLACDSLLHSVVSTSSECADKGPGTRGVSSKAPPPRVQEGAEALSYGLPQGAGGEERGTQCHLGGCSGSTGDEEAMAQRFSVTWLHWYCAMATPVVR